VPLSARLVPAMRGDPAMVQVLHQKTPNQANVVIVSIDDALKIWDGKGHVFGRLTQRPLNGGAAGGTAARPSTLRECCPDLALPQSTPCTPGSSTVTLPVPSRRSFKADSCCQFVLEEASGKPARWTMAYNPPAGTGSFMEVKWLPKNQVLATIERNRRYLHVANNHGVDAALVLVCTLGLLAFKLSMDDAWGQSTYEEHTEEPTNTAASLLERLQLR